MEVCVAQGLIEEVYVELERICREKGLILEERKGKIVGDYFSLKADISWLQDGLTRHQASYLEHCEILGMHPDWISKQTIYNAERYEIIGYFPSKYKKPVKIINHTKQKCTYVHPDKVKILWGKGKTYWRDR